MQANTFADFVARQQVSDESQQIDWVDIRDEWLANLDMLYTRILDFLQDYISSGQIVIGFQNLPLNEENLGSYVARQMNLNIGRQRVSLVPKGTLFIGCKGRVDAVGSVGQASLLLLDERSKRLGDRIKVTVTVYDEKSTPAPEQPEAQEDRHWTWKILSNTPLRDLVEIDRESFSQLLMEVANG